MAKTTAKNKKTESETEKLLKEIDLIDSFPAFQAFGLEKYKNLDPAVKKNLNPALSKKFEELVNS